MGRRAGDACCNGAIRGLSSYYFGNLQFLRSGRRGPSELVMIAGAYGMDIRAARAS